MYNPNNPSNWSWSKAFAESLGQKLLQK